MNKTIDIKAEPLLYDQMAVKFKLPEGWNIGPNDILPLNNDTSDRPVYEWYRSWLDSHKKKKKYESSTR